MQDDLTNDDGASKAPTALPDPLAGLTPTELKTVASYDGIARTWTADKKARDPRFWAGEVSRLVEFLPPGRRVLDVGCGSGVPTQLLREAGCVVTGVDASVEMLRVAEDNCPGATFVHGSMYDLRFPDASFDGATMFASLLHAPKLRAALVLREIRRVVAPGGVVLVATKRGEGEETMAREGGDRYFAYYQAEELKALMAACGLHVFAVEEREANWSWLTMLARRR